MWSLTSRRRRRDKALDKPTRASSKQSRPRKLGRQIVSLLPHEGEKRRNETDLIKITALHLLDHESWPDLTTLERKLREAGKDPCLVDCAKDLAADVGELHEDGT